uniref:Uncharacterized protein n=1 Tax=Oryza meridionalis TaxID=40149 RepID=A0A0E0F9F6_9ORYZ
MRPAGEGVDAAGSRILPPPPLGATEVETKAASAPLSDRATAAATLFQVIDNELGFVTDYHSVLPTLLSPRQLHRLPILVLGLCVLCGNSDIKRDNYAVSFGLLRRCGSLGVAVFLLSNWFTVSMVVRCRWTRQSAGTSRRSRPWWRRIPARAAHAYGKDRAAAGLLRLGQFGARRFVCDVSEGELAAPELAVAGCLLSTSPSAAMMLPAPERWRLLTGEEAGGAGERLLRAPTRGGLAKVVTTEAIDVPFNFLNSFDVDQRTGDVYFTDSSSTYRRRYPKLNQLVMFILHSVHASCS